MEKQLYTDRKKNIDRYKAIHNRIIDNNQYSVNVIKELIKTNLFLLNENAELKKMDYPETKKKDLLNEKNENANQKDLYEKEINLLTKEIKFLKETSDIHLKMAKDQKEKYNSCLNELRKAEEQKNRINDENDKNKEKIKKLETQIRLLERTDLVVLKKEGEPMSRSEKIQKIRDEYDDVIIEEINDLYEYMGDLVKENVKNEKKNSKIHKLLYSILMKYSFKIVEKEVQDFIWENKTEQIFSIDDEKFKTLYKKNREKMMEKIFEPFFKNIQEMFEGFEKEKVKKLFFEILKRTFNLVLDMKTCDLSFYLPEENEEFNPDLCENRRIKKLKIGEVYKPALMKGTIREWRNKIFVKADVNTKIPKKKKTTKKK